MNFTQAREAIETAQMTDSELRSLFTEAVYELNNPRNDGYSTEYWSCFFTVLWLEYHDRIGHEFFCQQLSDVVMHGLDEATRQMIVL